MDEVFVSVNIVTYNRESTILRAIDSVLNQTYSNIEIIVVDDGSIDNTSLILECLKDKIKYFKFSKKGKTYCREFAREVSQGHFVAFLDSDDFWKKDYISESIMNIKEYNLDILLNRCLNHCYSPEGGESVVLYSYPQIKNLILKVCPTPTSGMIIRSSLSEFKWNINHNTYEDWHLQIRLLFSNQDIKVGYCKDILWEKIEDETTFRKRNSRSFLMERLRASLELNVFLKDKTNIGEKIYSTLNVVKDSFRLIKNHFKNDSK